MFSWNQKIHGACPDPGFVRQTLAAKMHHVPEADQQHHPDGRVRIQIAEITGNLAPFDLINVRRLLPVCKWTFLQVGFVVW